VQLPSKDYTDIQPTLSREAQLFVGWVSGSVTHAGVGFHASTQPTFILYLIPPTHLSFEMPTQQADQKISQLSAAFEMCLPRQIV